MAWRHVTDAQWGQIRRELPPVKPRPVDGAGTPLGAYLDAASPAEVTLLEKTLATVAVKRAGKRGRPRTRPERLIADRGYDSNPLRAALARRGIEPIILARRTDMLTLRRVLK